MTDFAALVIYVIALFFLGIGNAIVIYHILRYRDPDDASGLVLIVYLILAFVIIVGTALFLRWTDIFP